MGLKVHFKFQYIHETAGWKLSALGCRPTGGDPQVRADPRGSDSAEDVPMRERDRAAFGLARQGDELLVVALGREAETALGALVRGLEQARLQEAAAA